MIRRRISIAVMALLVLIAGLAALRRLARSRTTQLFGDIVARANTSERRVALTFDDGPAPPVVDSIIALLRSREVRATFFVTGNELAASPGAGRRLVEAGHELGNHSFSHDRMVLKSQRFIRTEVERTDSLIHASGQEGTIFFRPPFGYKLAGLPWYLSRRGRTTVTWDIEPDSYPDVAATSDGIVRHVLERVRPGSIILLHIWYPSRATSLGAVAPLIDSLRARGYRVGPVRDLLAERRESDSPRGSYTRAVAPVAPARTRV